MFKAKVLLIGPAEVNETVRLIVTDRNCVGRLGLRIR